MLSKILHVQSTQINQLLRVGIINKQFVILPQSMLKILLYPLGLCYGIIIFIRNKLFDWGILTSYAFPVPVISVGNLSTGGTGKTPHVEYLIRLLKNDFKVVKSVFVES